MKKKYRERRLRSRLSVYQIFLSLLTERWHDVMLPRYSPPARLPTPRKLVCESEPLHCGDSTRASGRVVNAAKCYDVDRIAAEASHAPRGSPLLSVLMVRRRRGTVEPRPSWWSRAATRVDRALVGTQRLITGRRHRRRRLLPLPATTTVQLHSTVDT